MPPTSRGASTPATHAPAVTTSCDPQAVLGQVDEWERLGPEQLDAAYARSKKAFESHGDFCDRLRIGALAVLQSSRGNEAYALKLLEDSLETSGRRGSPRLGFARLLTRILRERVETDAHSKAAARKAADEQNRADTCKRQLDELRNVEKIIDERGTR
jgi:hypothetical protein